MKIHFLEFIVCANCKGKLDLYKIGLQNGDEIENGLLKCLRCDAEFEISGGIAMFTGNVDMTNELYEKHASDFDQNWGRLNEIRTQEDLNGTKANPRLTENAVRMQVNTCYRYCNFAEAKILDVGCGLGFNLQRIKKRMPDCILFGIDVSEVAVRVARENKTPAFLAVAFAEALPFANDFFDLLISNETLEHVVRPDLCLAEMCKVLKKSGKIIISTPNGSGLFISFISPLKEKIKKYIGRNIETPYRDSPLSVPELRKICHHNNIRIEKLIYTAPFYFLGGLITEHFPKGISKLTTDLIIKYSDLLARIFFVRRFICDEITVVIKKVGSRREAFGVSPEGKF